MDDKRAVGHAMADLAADNAGEVWKAEAYAAFREYAIDNEMFTTEQVRKFNTDMDSPPDERAWGSIALRAKRDGIIVAEGLMLADRKPAHGRYVTKWRSLIYRGAHENNNN